MGCDLRLLFGRWLSALAVAWCGAWASTAAAQAVEPLIEYRRADSPQDVGANPLRPQGEPEVTAPAAPHEEPAPAAPAVVVQPAVGQPVYRDPQVAAAQFAEDKPDKNDENAPAPVVDVLDPADFSEAAQPLAAPQTTEQPPAAQPQAAQLLAAQPSAAPADDFSLRLAPPSSTSPVKAGGDRGRFTKLVPESFSRLTSLSTAGGGLAIVVGLFLVCTWLLRGGGGARRSGTLPQEAFAVLGRAPLTTQSFAQLLRLGNKLVLVAVAADGARPLAEVTDPAEVDRIVGLCAKSAPHGPSAEFQQVLEQLSREPARGFLGREGSGGRRKA